VPELKIDIQLGVRDVGLVRRSQEVKAHSNAITST
jgi:hypothetical protein